MKKSKKPNKNFKRDFNRHKNNTLCYIHIKNTEIPVTLHKDKNVVTLTFNYQGKFYQSEKIEINSINDRIGLNTEKIIFNSIVLDDIDISNLTDCIDDMFDYQFG